MNVLQVASQNAQPTPVLVMFSTTVQIIATFEGLLHSTIGMKVKGVICKVTGGIDGVQTEFLSQSDRTSGHGPVKSPTIRGTSEANVEGMVVDGFHVGCESEFLVQTQYSRCKI